MKKTIWSQDIPVAIVLLAGSAFLMFHAVTVQSAEDVYKRQPLCVLSLAV